MTARTFARRAGRRVHTRAGDEVWRLRNARRRRRSAAASAEDLRRVTVRGQPLYGRVVDRFSATGAADENLRIVVAALEHAGAPCFLVPSGRLRHTVGVHEAYRESFLDSLRAQQAGRAVFVGRPLRGGRLRHAAVLLDRRLPRPLRSAPVLRVGELRLGPAGQLLDGLGLGCDIEFWQDGAGVRAAPDAERRLARLWPQASADTVDDCLVAPRRNRIAEAVPATEQKPATVRAAGREIPTFAAFTLPTTDDVTFPVDAVYTWVDGDDPAMRAKRNRHERQGTADILARELGPSRYTDHDELRYSLRSLEAYAGFIRRIFLVTDGQRPPWLDESAEGLTVVDHRDIFPSGVLPVFNSHAIETRLHHIRGLAEHYLYFNDDVFVGRRVTPEHFFHGSGLLRVPLSPLKIGVGKPHAEETATNSAGKNVRRLLLDSYGRLATHNFLHTPLPQRRTLLMELEQSFPADLARTTASRFRSPQDVALTSPLLYQHALMTGRGVAGRYSYRYVDIGRADAQRRLDDLRRNRRFDFFCLNDVDGPRDTADEDDLRLRAFLEEYFPFPSRFEKPDRGAGR